MGEHEGNDVTPQHYRCNAALVVTTSLPPAPLVDTCTTHSTNITNHRIDKGNIFAYFVDFSLTTKILTFVQFNTSKILS